MWSLISDQPGRGWGHPMLLHAFLGFGLGSAAAEAHRGQWIGCSSPGGAQWGCSSGPRVTGLPSKHTGDHRIVSASSEAMQRAPSATTPRAPGLQVSPWLFFMGPAVFCFCTTGFFLPPVQPISVLCPLWCQSYFNSKPYPRPQDLWSLYRHKAD